MTPSDISSLTKDAIRLVSTAGLGKDVIDLLTAKLEILRDELSATKELLSDAKSENADLKIENAELKKQIQNFIPRSEMLEHETHSILELFFKHDEASASGISSHIGMELGMVNYHIDILRELKFIAQSRFAVGGIGAMYRIRPEGRAYIVKQKRG